MRRRKHAGDTQGIARAGEPLAVIAACSSGPRAIGPSASSAPDPVTSVAPAAGAEKYNAVLALAGQSMVTADGKDVVMIVQVSKAGAGIRVGHYVGSMNIETHSIATGEVASTTWIAAVSHKRGPALLLHRRHWRRRNNLRASALKSCRYRKVSRSSIWLGIVRAKLTQASQLAGCELFGEWAYGACEC